MAGLFGSQLGTARARVGSSSGGAGRGSGRYARALARSCHHATAARISAQERRPLQRQRGGERVLRSLEGTERRHLVPRDDYRERSAVSGRAVRYEYGFQEATRCRWLESFRVFGDVTTVSGGVA